MKRLNMNFSVLIGCAFVCLLPLSPILGFAEEPERIAPMELKHLIDSGEKVVVVGCSQASGHTGKDIFRTRSLFRLRNSICDVRNFPKRG